MTPRQFFARLPLAALAALVLSLTVIPLDRASADAPKILVYDFYFDNTSLEQTTPAETARLKAVSDALRDGLAKSNQYEPIAAGPRPPSVQSDITKCSDAERAAAQKAGATLVACGWIQKVSNLILNLNLAVVEAKTGKFVHGGSVDIRGNTDESWDRGLKFLLKEHVFKDR